MLTEMECRSAFASVPEYGLWDSACVVMAKNAMSLKPCDWVVRAMSPDGELS